MTDSPNTTNLSDAQGTTPLVRQYLAFKSDNPDRLLFFRVGAFYDLYFADAEIAAAALGLGLHRRGRCDGQQVAACRVPVHAADGHLQNLIRKGHSAAICEQIEATQTARQRGRKAIVRRDVVRWITPGIAA